MEFDSPPPDDPPSPNELSLTNANVVQPNRHKDYIVKRLSNRGVPEEYINMRGLSECHKDNICTLPDLVSAILPNTVDDVEDAQFKECMDWLQWLMFEGYPEDILMKLDADNVGPRGVCSTILGRNQIAHRCKTCERGPNSVLCDPCFRSSKHKDHDSLIIHAIGGCCDCGDLSAWKQDPFCPSHIGVEQIPLLSNELMKSSGPVLDLLFSHWNSSLADTEAFYHGNRLLFDILGNSGFRHDGIKCGLSIAIVQMLLYFFKCSESLRGFVSAKAISSVGLLDSLVKAEWFLKAEDTLKIHQLLIILMKEPLFKDKFADVFIKYYRVAVSDFMKHGGDAAFRRCPLLRRISVQIFDVSNISLRLVKEEGLLDFLLECLDNIFKSCAGQDGQLEVQKWVIFYEISSQILDDIRCIIKHVEVAKYVEYDRRDILKKWILLLGIVQGMNPKKRAIDKWLDVDNATRTLSRADPTDITSEIQNTTEIEPLSVLSVSVWPDIIYDVSSQKVSTDIPLHRLLSNILRKSAEKFNDELSSSKKLNISSYPSSSLNFWENNLHGCHNYGFSAYIMEHPLRIRVFCAQVHAGLWKSNRDAAKYLEWYRSVRWDSQDLELDLFLLQCCAALAPADLYVTRLLHRFELSHYINLKIQQVCRDYELVMMRELISLIIQVVQTRRFCGLSSVECVERHLVHTLATGDATHSELVESLPHDLFNIDHIHGIVDKVAKPFSLGNNRNEIKCRLRLEYWKQLDFYYPLWSLKELMIARERYLQFCKTSASTSQFPKWTNIYEPFDDIARVATCEVVLRIFGAVLLYGTSTGNCDVSVLWSALHLLSLALDISSQQREASIISRENCISLPILDLASNELFTRHADGSGGESLLSLLVTLMHSNEGHVKCFSPVVKTLLGKFADLDPKCMETLLKLAPEVINPASYRGTHQDDSIPQDDSFRARKRKAAADINLLIAKQRKVSDFIIPIDDLDESEDLICYICRVSNSESPMGFPVLLQKSRLQSLADRRRPTWNDTCCSKEPEMSSRPHGFGPLDCDGVHLSSCGHAVHLECLDKYLSSAEGRVGKGAIVGMDKGEFNCVNCRAISNAISPALHNDSKQSMDCVTSENKENRELLLQKASSLIKYATSKCDFLDQNGHIGRYHKSVIKLLSEMHVLEDQDKALETEHVNMIMWDVIRYSLISLEISSRSGKSSLLSNDTTDVLFKVLESSGSSVLFSILKTVQETKNGTSHSASLRLKGIELISKSLGVDSLLEGHVPLINQDNEFLRRVSSPILSVDAFSSLMWTLYCMPSHIPSLDDDSFISLVHMFYGISVVQAIIAYFGTSQSDIVGDDRPLIRDIICIIRDCGDEWKNISSNHLDGSSIESVIDDFCAPYLRRCSLLYKVMSYPICISYNEAHTLLKIPILQQVLGNKTLCSEVPKWMRHFRNQVGIREVKSLTLTSIPFELIELPELYDDLLHRYHGQCCPECSIAFPEPALCLICGQLCNASTQICCSKMSCETHAMVCAAGVGVFLLIDRTNILIQRASRMSPWSCIYLNKYGEEDMDLVAGQPLYLNKEKYATLTNMVASHGIPQSFEILHKINLAAAYKSL